MSMTTGNGQKSTTKPAAKISEARAYAATSASSPLAPATIRRREPGPTDVQLEILYCGICHSDLHTVRDEWSGFMPTTYSPIRRWGDIKGKKVGVVGLGGLGHMGVKFARAFGAHVVVFTTSPAKKADALRLGAHEVILSRDPEEMKAHAGTFDFILDTISADHDINAYINMLGRDGNITLVGAPEKPLSVAAFALLFGRKSVSGSLIGGIPETQEMLDFCGEHGITADVEVIPAPYINTAYERLLRSDVKYRFSIDMASLTSK